MTDDQTAPRKPLFGMIGRFGLVRNFLTDRQVDNIASKLDTGFEKVSTSISHAAVTIGDAAGVAISCAGATGVLLVLLASRRRQPHPQHMLMSKPRVDTIKHAQTLAQDNSSAPPSLTKKMELEGVTQKAFAFCISSNVGQATKTFQSKINATRLDEKTKDMLSKIDIDLSPEQETMDKDFVVKDGEGLYYFYTLRSTLATCPHREVEKVYVAFMLCTCSFSTLQKLEKVEETTVTDPVYTVTYEPVLKRGGWISSFFRPNEYSIETRKVYNGTITRTVRTPVFEKMSFTSKDVDDLKAHMVRQAAKHAQVMMNPENKTLTLRDAARELE